MTISILQRLRGSVFWTLDWLRGAPVARAVQELRRAEQLGLGNAEVLRSREQALEGLLKHAVGTVPFYEGLDASAGLTSFPVIDKKTFRSNQRDLLSTKPFRHVRTMRTSGSTGAPFAVEQDRGKTHRVQAELIYFNSKLGWRVGEPLPFLKILDASSSRSRIRQWLTNNRVIDVSNLDALQVAQELSLLRGGLLMSYASTLDGLKSAAPRMRPLVQGVLRAILSGAEPLYEDTRQAIESLFGCPCVSRYSNQENGVLAQEDRTKGVFVVNSVNYVIEVLDMHEDRAADEGSVGRIVVTDLHNQRTPMIRYDTGDVAALTTERRADGATVQTLTRLSGRRWDHLFAEDGSWVSAHILTNMFRNSPHVYQFRCTQHALGAFTLELEVAPEFRDEDAVLKRLRDVLGDGAAIEIAYMDHLESAPSGKRRVVINEILQGTSS